MRTSIQIGRIIGIPIRLHITFLLILPLIIVLFAEGPGPMGLGETEVLSRYLRYLIAGIAASLFFFSLILHELSHSYVAMKYGTRITSITLFIFGGLALMEDLPRDPDKEWRIAIAGPLMSFALGGFFLSAYLGIQAVEVVVNPVRILVSSIGLLNIMLGTFNLLPAFPMDGGRVLRALLAQRMHFLKATRRAVFVGKVFAVALGILGFMPDPVLLYMTGELRMPFNLWLTLIAAFLYIAATEEERATIIFTALEGTKVRAVMRRENAAVPQGMPIAELAEKMLRERNADYAVVSEDGDLKGLITFNEIKRLSGEQRRDLKVSALMNPLDPMRDTISGDEEAIKALKKMVEHNRNSLAVVDAGSGTLAGIITKRDLTLHLELMKGHDT